MNSIEDFYHWLNGFINFEKRPHDREFSLDVIRRYAAVFSDPQRVYKTVHIAGSKGKGSVAAMTASLLTETGRRTGLYTSPHVNDFRERITENGRFFSDEAYTKAFRTIRDGTAPLIGNTQEPQPSWFELLTLTAFVLFRQEGLDWAVFETGMGGRLDATNIIEPDLVLLTPVEREHCEYLGNTLSLIAAEKAGIIKKNTPVFCSRQHEDVLQVFKDTAERAGAPFFYLPEAVEALEYAMEPAGLKLTVRFSSGHPAGAVFGRPISTHIPLFTPVQAENAALAAAAFKYLYPDTPEAVIERALSKAWLPARFQVLQTSPLTVIDGAHTFNSIQTCAQAFFSLSSRKALLVFACAKDKHPEDLAPVFAGKVSHIYLTVPGAFKKGDLAKTVHAFLQAFRAEKEVFMESSEDFQTILKAAFEKSRAENRPLLITGSFYLAAEAQRLYSAADVPDRETKD
ncbi:MAG: bifunctional folylpolyglutamate synthase/dihydrofolate synthase [Treponema sp.]